MKKNIIEATCDLCGKMVRVENTKDSTGISLNLKLQVIFTTEQTEGRSTDPYLTETVLDICDDCMETLLHGNSVFGSGAMGNNHYYFRDGNTN